MNLLLIEPDADQGRQWQAWLSEYAHQADIAFDGKIGYSLAVHRRYDCVLIHLPDPMTWVQAMREKDITLPALILLSPTATTDSKRLMALPWVDSYHLPWQTDELVSRLQFLADRRRMSMGTDP